MTIKSKPYNIYIPSRSLLLEKHFPTNYTYTEICTEVQSHDIQVAKIYAVKNDIEIPNYFGEEVPFESLSDLKEKNLTRLGRRTTLQELFPNPAPDCLHLLVASHPLGVFRYYRSDTESIETASPARGATMLKEFLPHGIIYKSTSAIKTQADAQHAVANTSPFEGLSPQSRIDAVYPVGPVLDYVDFFVVMPSHGDVMQNMLSSLPLLQRRQVFYQTRPLVAPSSEGQTAIFEKRQNKDGGRVYCGRPVTFDLPIPASLYHPILLKFQHDLNASIPSTSDWDCFWRLREEMSQFFVTEALRREALIAILRDFDIEITPATIGAYADDGDIRVARFFAYIQKLKKELAGTTAEPFFELIGYYLAASSDGMKADASDYLGFPCTLVVLTGSMLIVAVGVWTDVPHVEALASIPLHAHATNHTVLDSGARFICALRSALNDLETFYRSKSWEERKTQVCFPFVNSFMQSDSQVFFRYDSQLEGKRVFFAHRLDNPSERLIIKFTQRYCEVAHRQAYDLGIAPELLSVQFILGWYVIVMADVSSSYVPANEVDITVELQVSIKTAVLTLHDLGFVHGDVRSPNILVRKNSAAGGSIILLLDFDWPGLDGETFYPRRMNKDIAWAEGAEVTRPITKAHDIYMLRLLCPDIDV